MHPIAALHPSKRRSSGHSVAARPSTGVGALFALLATLGTAQVSAQAPEPPQAPPPSSQPAPAPIPSPQQSQRIKLNQRTLILAASRPGASYLAMANDLISAIGKANGVRILPVAADGGVANLQDVLFLRGVDMAIVPANVLAHAKSTKAFGGGLPNRLGYLTALYSEEVHLVVDQGIGSVGDLRGKRIAVPADDGTAEFTAADIFQRLDVAVESLPMQPGEALEGVRAGTVAAALLFGGKPLAQVSALPKDGKLRLLSLPFATLAGEAYSPAVLLAEDYPALIPPGAMVETVAVKAVLMAPRGSDEAGRRVAKHIPAVLEAVARLAVSQRHPKWKDVNLGAVVPGWTRLEAADAWLKQAFAQRREVLKGHFDEFLLAESRVKSTELSAPQRKKLLDDFEAWTRKSVTGEPQAK